MIWRRFFRQWAAAASYFGLAIAGMPTLGFSRTIDQQNVGPIAIHFTDLNKGDDFELLQSFTAGITGTLDEIALPIYEDVIIPPPYDGAVWYNSDVTVTVLNSKLEALGSTIIKAASIPDISSSRARKNAVDVKARFRLPVTSGSTYFIAIQANRLVPTDYGGNGLSWFATVADYKNGGPYGSYQGSLFPFFDHSYDLEFQTYVTPTREVTQTFLASTHRSVVPEPSTWVMMLFGFAGLVFAGLTHQRHRLADARRSNADAGRTGKGSVGLNNDAQFAKDWWDTWTTARSRLTVHRRKEVARPAR